MLFNEVIEHEVTADIETEPVNVEDVLRQLNMLFDTDGSFSFTDDNTLIGDIITASRQYLEEYAGLSFGEKTIVAIVRNELGDVEIPYGPVISITSVKNSDGDSLTEGTDYKLSGNKFKKICWPKCSYLEITYTAGYATLPEAIKRAVIVEAAYRWTNRGTEQGASDYCRTSLELLAPYKRTSWLV